MIRSAAVLIRERGVEATSLADVIAHSGAPRGSIYHHFPGGKTQLVEEATAYAAEYIGRGLAAALAGADPQSALRAFAATWRGILEQSDFGAGCPVVASTLEGDRNPAARAIAGAGFASWQAMVAEALAGRGVDRGRAAAVAALAVAAIEGGVILARAQRSLAPLEGVADELVRIVDGALAEAGAR
jgi:AcrR family transcriptional regulator